MKQEFDFILDEKVNVWNRKQFSIEAETIEEARNKAIELVKNAEDIDFYDSEYLYESEELMNILHNNGNPTIVLMQNSEKNSNIIYENDYRTQ
jgi:PHD/YefM family antitoxin component YafN of YafNO toxin-antitoxin module